jgi:hypothetical protein
VGSRDFALRQAAAPRPCRSAGRRHSLARCCIRAAITRTCWRPHESASEVPRQAMTGTRPYRRASRIDNSRGSRLAETLPARRYNDRAMSAMASIQSSTPPKSRPWRTTTTSRSGITTMNWPLFRRARSSRPAHRCGRSTTRVRRILLITQCNNNRNGQTELGDPHGHMFGYDHDGLRWFVDDSPQSNG